MLAAKGFFKETPELIAAYDRSVERYFTWRADYGRQFSGRGTGIVAEDPTATHRNTDWSRKNVVVLSSGGGWARLVNDEEIIKERVGGVPQQFRPGIPVRWLRWVWLLVRGIPAQPLSHL